MFDTDPVFLLVDQSASTTLTNVTVGGFNISYVDGTYAAGDYIQDAFAVGDNQDASMTLQMGLVNDTASNYTGIMGHRIPQQ